MSGKSSEILVIVVMAIQIPVVIFAVAIISSDKLTNKVRQWLTRGGER